MSYPKSYNEAKGSALEDLKRLIDVNTRPVAIKFDGQFIVMRSGKGAWRSERDARLALNQELSWAHFKPDYDQPGIGYHTGKEWYAKFVKEMVDAGRIEFVTLEGTTEGATVAGGGLKRKRAPEIRCL